MRHDEIRTFYILQLINKILTILFLLNLLMFYCSVTVKNILDKPLC